MPDKPDDRPDDERRKLWSDIESTAQNLFGEEFSGHWNGNMSGRQFSPDHSETVGICATCQSYEFAEDSMHQIVHARCAQFDRPLGRSRIVNCSGYSEKGRLSLNTMFAMATLIDVPKAKIGF